VENYTDIPDKFTFEVSGEPKHQ